MRRWRVAIYGAGVTRPQVSLQACTCVRAWTADGAQRKALRWYEGVRLSGHVWEVKVQRLHLR